MVTSEGSGRSWPRSWNPLGHALLAGHLDFASPDDPALRPNLTRMLFLDPHTRELHTDWKSEARVALAALRLVAGRNRAGRWSGRGVEGVSPRGHRSWREPGPRPRAVRRP